MPIAAAVALLVPVNPVLLIEECEESLLVVLFLNKDFTDIVPAN